MKNILVTGGLGFIGSHTTVELTQAGYSPIIVDNLSNSTLSVLDNIAQIIGEKPTFYKGDFQDRALLEKVLSEQLIDGVIHFAAYKAVGESVEKPLAYYQNNVAGLVNLLEVLTENKVSNLVFSSSCTVYGEPDKLPVTEDAPIKPAASPYGATKQMCENIIHDSCRAPRMELRAISLRYFNPIGAHESGLIGELPIGVPQNLVPFVTQTAAGVRKELTVFGDDYDTPDGSNIRDYIHVVDLAKAHIKALEYIHDKQPGFYDVCNIGTGQGSSVLDVIKTFEEATGVKLSYKIGARRPGDVVKTYASVHKAKRILGWEAEKTLSNALQDAWQWQKRLNKEVK